MSIYSQFPDQIPSVNLNFAKTKRLDSKFNFARASTGTFVDSTGLVKTAALNTPRFDHDFVTGECRGLLVEESRTNLVSNSNLYNAWGSNSVTTPLPTNNVSSVIAPDGTNTAWQYPESSTGFLQCNYTVLPNTNYTWSFFAKQGPVSSSVSVSVAGPFPSGAISDNVYDWNTQILALNWNKINCSNGWIRFWRTFNTGSDTLFLFKLSTSGNNSGYFWGSQLEIGLGSPSHIPTSGSTVTRAADILSPYPLNDFKSSRIIFTPTNTGNSVVPSIVVKDSQSTPEYALEISTPNKVPTVTTKFNNVIQSTATFVRPQTSTDEINLGINYEKTTGKVSICTNVTDEVNSAVVTIPETCNLKLPTGYTLNQLEIKNSIIKSIYTWDSTTATSDNLIAFTEKSLAKNNPEKISVGLIDKLYQKADPVNNGKPSLDLNFAENKSLIDDVSQSNLITFSRASTATYVDFDGLIKSVAVNEARFDHDLTTGESLGLLIEEQRDNLLTNSSIIFKDGRSVSDTLYGINLYTATGNANTVAYNSSSDIGNSSYFSITSGVVYTVSFYAKRGTNSNGFVRFYNNIGQTLSNESAFAIPSDGGRISVQLTASSTSSLAQFFITGVSNGFNIKIGGMQVEQGAFPTSYIPTSGSTVTRSRDNASITGTNFSSWYNTDQGSFVSYYRHGSTGKNLVANIVSPGSNTNNRFFASSPTLATTTTELKKTAYNYTQFNTDGIVQSVINGGVQGYYYPLESNYYPVQLQIGNTTGSSYHNGTISRLAYWPVHISNDTLQTTTSTIIENWSLEFDSSIPSDGICALITSGTVTYTVDWGDESAVETVNATGTFTKTHSYTIPQKYTVKITVISGTFRPLYNNLSYATAITKINQTPSGSWGGFGTSLSGAFYRASNLTFIEAINTTDVTNFQNAWRSCSSLVRFPPLTLSSGTNFIETWRDCTSLAHFPASRFGTSTATNYSNAFTNCALTSSSIENILVSINTSNISNGTLGIAGGTNASKTTWTTLANAAYNALVAKGWAITFNA